MVASEVYQKKSFRELVKHPRDVMGIRAMYDAQENAQWPKDYVHVATVESDDREDAFQLTNSIDYGWWKNSGVTPHGDAAKGCRSTSVGDVVVAGGEVWKCAGVGWDRIEQAEVA